jgi:tetrapyrrole methylase family protein/MazG family protein/ATP diphosphatase
VKLSKRAARVGFVWPSVKEVMEKLHEEVAELEAELAAGDVEKARQEMGDVLFVVANLARTLEVDPEDALRATNAKFGRRFRYIEARLAERGKTPDQSDLAEMDALWDEIRAAEKQQPLVPAEAAAQAEPDPRALRDAERPHGSPSPRG